MKTLHNLRCDQLIENQLVGRLSALPLKPTGHPPQCLQATRAPWIEPRGGPSRPLLLPMAQRPYLFSGHPTVQK